MARFNTGYRSLQTKEEKRKNLHTHKSIGKGWKYKEGVKPDGSHNNGNGKKGHKKGGYRAWLHTRHKIRKSLVR